MCILSLSVVMGEAECFGDVHRAPISFVVKAPRRLLDHCQGLGVKLKLWRIGVFGRVVSTRFLFDCRGAGSETKARLRRCRSETMKHVFNSLNPLHINVHSVLSGLSLFASLLLSTSSSV